MIGLAIVAALLLAQTDAAGAGVIEKIGPWAQLGGLGLFAWVLLTKTIPKINESADARTTAMLKALDDQRNTSSAAFRALTDDYRDEMRLEREAHHKEHTELRADLRAIADRIDWGSNGKDRSTR